MSNLKMTYTCENCGPEATHSLEKLYPCIESADFGIALKCDCCGAMTSGDNAALTRSVVVRNPQHPVWDHLREVFDEHGVLCEVLESPVTPKWWDFKAKRTLREKKERMSRRKASMVKMEEARTHALRYGLTSASDGEVSLSKLGKVLDVDHEHSEARFLRLLIAAGLIERRGGTTSPFAVVEVWEQCVQILNSDIEWALSFVSEPLPHWARKYPQDGRGYLYTQKMHDPSYVENIRDQLPEWRDFVSRIKKSAARRR